MFKLAAAFAIQVILGPSASLVEKPPVWFQRPPSAPAIIAFASPAAIDAFCRTPETPANIVILACTFPDKHAIAMPDPCLFPGEYYASLQCHENGHLNGWRH